VRIDIYNLIGEKVQTLINETQRMGCHRTFWDGKNERGIQMSSGIYYYAFVGGNQTHVKKMALIK